MPGDAIEEATGVDFVAAARVFEAEVIESATAADTIDAVQQIGCSVSEAASAAATDAVFQQMLAAIVAGATAASAQASAGSLSSNAPDTAFGADEISAELDTFYIYADVYEVAAAQDTPSTEPIWRPVPDVQSAFWTLIDTNAR